MCGKDYKALSVPINCPGSPPLAREGRAVTICIIPLSRITPACVGRTQRCPNLVLLRQDHPRVCGNDCVVTSHGFKGRGSPPLAREGHSLINFMSIIFRITPARAGRTGRLIHSRCRHKDHPRSRGKDIKRSRILQCFILIDPVISLLSPKASNKFPHRPMLCAALFRQFHTLL